MRAHMRAWRHARNLHGVARVIATDLVQPLDCYSAASKCIYDVDGHDTGERKIQRPMFHVDYSCLYVASVATAVVSRNMRERRRVCIKRIKIQAGAQNVRIHCGLYLPARFSTPREYKNRSLRLCFITRVPANANRNDKNAWFISDARSWG